MRIKHSYCKMKSQNKIIMTSLDNSNSTNLQKSLIKRLTSVVHRLEVNSDLVPKLKAGFAFLPFLWCVNAVWFFREAFKKPPYDQQREIKRYVIFSGIGGIIWIVALTIWIIVFQTNRAAWGEMADKISFMIPAGIP